MARAFFRDASLLILHELAAALDPIAEQLLYERVEELCASRSVLLISHRFSTVRLADRIYVPQEGRVVEHGTHVELMALDGTMRSCSETRLRATSSRCDARSLRARSSA